MILKQSNEITIHYSIVKKIHAFRILISNYCQYWYLYVWKAWKIYLYIWQKPERFTWMSDKGLKVLGMDSTGCLFPSWTIFAKMFTTNYQLLQLEQSKYWIDRETPRTNQHNVQQTCVVTWRDSQGCQGIQTESVYIGSCDSWWIDFNLFRMVYYAPVHLTCQRTLWYTWPHVHLRQYNTVAWALSQ